MFPRQKSKINTNNVLVKQIIHFFGIYSDKYLLQHKLNISDLPCNTGLLYIVKTDPRYIKVAINKSSGLEMDKISLDNTLFSIVTSKDLQYDSISSYFSSLQCQQAFIKDNKFIVQNMNNIIIDSSDELYEDDNSEENYNKDDIIVPSISTISTIPITTSITQSSIPTPVTQTPTSITQPSIPIPTPVSQTANKFISRMKSTSKLLKDDEKKEVNKRQDEEPIQWRETRKKDLFYISHIGVIINNRTKFVLGSADGLNDNKNLINPRRNITIEQYDKVKQILPNDLKFASAILNNPNVVPWKMSYVPERPPPKTGKFNASYTSEFNKVLLPGRKLNLIVDAKTKTVEGSADGLDVNNKFINPKRNITNRQAIKVANILSFDVGIINNPYYVPWINTNTNTNTNTDTNTDNNDDNNIDTNTDINNINDNINKEIEVNSPIPTIESVITTPITPSISTTTAPTAPSTTTVTNKSIKKYFDEKLLTNILPANNQLTEDEKQYLSNVWRKQFETIEAEMKQHRNDLENQFIREAKEEARRLTKLYKEKKVENLTIMLEIDRDSLLKQYNINKKAKEESLVLMKDITQKEKKKVELIDRYSLIRTNTDNIYYSATHNFVVSLVNNTVIGSASNIDIDSELIGFTYRLTYAQKYACESDFTIPFDMIIRDVVHSKVNSNNTQEDNIIRFI